MTERMESATRLLSASRSEDLDEAARLVREGRVVAFPTETVYGLAALGLDEAAVARMYEAKGRPARVPLTLMVGSLADALALWREDTPEEQAAKGRARALGERFWPGPLTLVSFKRRDIPDATTGGSDRVGVRIPRHEAALALLSRVGAPVVAPSANPSGALSPTRAAHVERLLSGHIAAILDGGPSQLGLESTVLDVSTVPARVLRRGALSVEEIGEIVDVAPLAPAAPPPVGPVRLVDEPALEEAWRSGDALVVRARSRAALEAALGPRAAPTATLPDDAAGFSAGVYDALFELVAEGAPRVWLEVPPERTRRWGALVGRLVERFGPIEAK